MADERISHIRRPSVAKSINCAPHNRLTIFDSTKEAAVTDTIYFLLAVAATSAVIFALPTRADRGRRRD